MNARPRRGRAAAGLALLGWLCVQASGSSQPAAPVRQGEAPGWEADWIERDFPFFSSVLDARAAGPPFPADNLTPRALVLNLGRGHWVAFDTDLLRVATAWRGQGVTPVALAPGSYHNPGRKTPGGQVPAPEPVGTVWVANGIYPGWQIGAHPSFQDPREPAPSPEEVGRGPLSEAMGRFKAIRHVPGGAVLEYTVGGTPIREWFTLSDTDRPRAIERHVEVGRASDTLWLLLGTTSQDISVALDEGAPSAALETIAITSKSPARGARTTPSDPAIVPSIRAVRVGARQQAVRFSVAFCEGTVPPAVTRRAIPDHAPPVRWPQEVRTKVSLSTKQAAYVVDDVELPRQNPWRRLVRASDVQFLPDGTGVVVTLDGDVWLARGLHERSGPVRWRRFASGLHEPLTLAIRDGGIYVFDRNGIWQLRDTNADGEADVHELFSNAFAQTADMREFPNTIRLAPDGAFVIAKGGQEATTIGKHNGSVLRVSADGREATVLGYGLRQPNLGVNLRTGLVTASDQQGHYVPSTPLHIIRDRQFYGFISTTLPPETYPSTPIADPLTWIPHAVNASAMSQVWLFDARLGPLNDSLVHIGFNRPELFRVVFNHRGRTPQAAVISITHDFDFPPLNGSVNPADGLLYLAGFQVLGWGTTAKRVTGMGRLRYTGGPSTLPREIAAMDKGVLLRFDVELDAARAADPSSYTVASWHYRRTHKYGSPQLKTDGTPGIDRLTPSSAHVSGDRRSVFVAVPGMTPVMQMQVDWSLTTSTGVVFKESASFTPYELTRFDPRADGFGALTIELAPTTRVDQPRKAPVSVTEGRLLYERIGCLACHANDRSTTARLGPSLAGLYGSPRTFADGNSSARADEAYLREAILEPAAKIVAGYERNGVGMPSYAGVLTNAQIESVILYIKSLK